MSRGRIQMPTICQAAFVSEWLGPTISKHLSCWIFQLLVLISTGAPGHRQITIPTIPITIIWNSISFLWLFQTVCLCYPWMKCEVKKKTKANWPNYVSLHFIALMNSSLLIIDPIYINLLLTRKNIKKWTLILFYLKKKIHIWMCCTFVFKRKRISYNNSSRQKKNSENRE